MDSNFVIDNWADGDVASENNILNKLLNYQKSYEAIRKQFSAIPEFDYTGQKTQLESLHTRVLANAIDERVIHVYRCVIPYDSHNLDM